MLQCVAVCCSVLQCIARCTACPVENFMCMFTSECRGGEGERERERKRERKRERDREIERERERERASRIVLGRSLLMCLVATYTHARVFLAKHTSLSLETHKSFS